MLIDSDTRFETEKPPYGGIFLPTESGMIQSDLKAVTDDLLIKYEDLVPKEPFLLGQYVEDENGPQPVPIVNDKKLPVNSIGLSMRAGEMVWQHLEPSSGGLRVTQISYFDRFGMRGQQAQYFNNGVVKNVQTLNEGQLQTEIDRIYKVMTSGVIEQRLGDIAEYREKFVKLLLEFEESGLAPITIQGTESRYIQVGPQKAEKYKKGLHEQANKQLSHDRIWEIPPFPSHATCTYLQLVTDSLRKRLF